MDDRCSDDTGRDLSQQLQPFAVHRLVIGKAGEIAPRPRQAGEQAAADWISVTCTNTTGVSALAGAEPIETFLLLVAERCVELVERGLNGLHRAQHRIEPLLHRL